MKRLLASLIFALLSFTAAAQTISPSQFGLNLLYPATNAPKVFMGVCRLWNATDFVGTDVSWAAVETANGVYSWAQLDAQVAQCQARGQQIIYTFGDVPGWANGNQAAYVPPTSFSTLYAFQTAVVTRYAGDGIIYSAWNEANLAANWWSGTQAQMLAIAQNLYSTVHSIDASAKVATPSVSPIQAGFVWFQQYLAAGGGAYADVMDVHCYPITGPSHSSVPATVTPEQNWNIALYFNTMFAYYGQASKPFICDEGGYQTTASTNLTAQQTVAYASIWNLLLASGGLTSWSWYEYDSPQTGTNAWGPLWDGGTWLNPVGQAFRITQGWLAGATFSSPIARVANTNQVRNPTGTGSSNGTVGGSSNTGAVPTNWSAYNPDSTYGITASITGTCSGGGYSGVLFKVAGTATTGASGFVQLSFETGTHVAASLGQQWTADVYVQPQSGAVLPADYQTVLEINENNSGGTYLDNILYYYFSAIPAPLANDQQSYATYTSNASVAYIVPNFTVTYTVGDTINATWCLAGPSLDTGSLWSGTLTRPGGYQAQVIWDSAGGPTSYTASGTYSWQRDLYGAGSRPILGNAVNLSNLPQLLENQQWRGVAF